MVEHRDRWASVLQAFVDGAGSRRITIHVFESGPRLRVVALVESGHPVGDFWHHAADFEIELSLAAPVTCVVNGRPRMWTITHGDADPLEELTWWALSELWDSELIETEASSWLVLGTEDPARDRAWRQIHDIRRLIAEHARRGVDPRAAALVEGMDNRTAYCAYAALLDDTTNRIAQMIKICPNVFSLVAVSSQSATNELTRIARAVCDGVKLPRIVDEALAIGLAVYRPQGCATKLVGGRVKPQNSGPGGSTRRPRAA